MRDELIGYFMGALEASEMHRVEQSLQQDPTLQRDAQQLERGLALLELDRESAEAPADLLQKTCALVDQDASRKVSLSDSRRREAVAGPSRGRWSMADVVVAAGVCLAAVMLFFPAIVNSRHLARLAACQNNQRELHLALRQFGERHQQTLPFVTAQDAAGIYAPILKDANLISDQKLFLCPASLLNGQRKDWQVPTVQLVRSAKGAHLAKLLREMGGDYAYVLGYIDDQGKLRPVKIRNRAHYALLADAPDVKSGRSAHGKGHNVTFEDGHVSLMTLCKSPSGDDIFLNDQGELAAGLHVEDSVLGASAVRPLPRKGINTSLTVPNPPK